MSPINTRRTGSAEYGRWIKALFCGDAGAGKTLLSSTFPYPFFASAEGGLMSIADRDIPYVELQNSKELFDLKQYLDVDPESRQKLLGVRVDTIVIDTVDQVQKILKAERLKEKGRESLSQDDWGWLGDQMESIINGFRNLDMHVVFTCHLKEARDEELGVIYYQPGLQGRIGGEIAQKVDLSLLLVTNVQTVVSGNQAEPKIVRHLQTYPDTQHTWIKDRSGKLPSRFPISDDFSDDFERLNKLIFSCVDQTPSKRTKVEKPAPESSAPLAEEVKPEETLSPETAEKIASLLIPGNKCAECGESVTADQATLSNMRARQVLCNNHYKAAMAAKKGK